METKALICLDDNEVAPRFDLTAEVMIASFGRNGKIRKERIMVLPQPSAEALCQMVLAENAQVVVCGGIEEEYYQYLSWKRVTVLDSVIGDCRQVLEHLAQGRLKAGDILVEPAGSHPRTNQ